MTDNLSWPAKAGHPGDEKLSAAECAAMDGRVALTLPGHDED